MKPRNVQQTSMLAYWELYDLNQRQTAVLATLRYLGYACNLDLAQAMAVPINQITPRIHELREKGLVKEHHRDNCKQTGRKAIFWVAI